VSSLISGKALFRKGQPALVEREGVKHYYVVADEEDIPMEAHSVDLVLSSMSMHWVRHF
jgi:ubiquinone/menaquinone biosynthesis C-methylase UbiE